MGKNRRPARDGFNVLRLKALFSAGARASSLGIAVLDSQTRFESVNAALAYESQAPLDAHLGRTSREVVGELAIQVEPIYEKVLNSGKAASVAVVGHVRDTPEVGHWLDYCFPVIGKADQQVQQLGLFVVNLTAERATREILDALTTDPKRILAEAGGLLDKYDQAVGEYQSALKRSFEDLSCPFTEPSRKAARFRSSIQRLDGEINDMRELIYAVMSHFSIPSC